MGVVAGRDHDRIGSEGLDARQDRARARPRRSRRRRSRPASGTFSTVSDPITGSRCPGTTETGGSRRTARSGRPRRSPPSRRRGGRPSRGRRPAPRRPCARSAGHGDGHVVQQAEAPSPVAAGMVARWTNRRERHRRVARLPRRRPPRRSIPAAIRAACHEPGDDIGVRVQPSAAIAVACRQPLEVRAVMDRGRLSRRDRFRAALDEPRRRPPSRRRGRRRPRHRPARAARDARATAWARWAGSVRRRTVAVPPRVSCSASPVTGRHRSWADGPCAGRPE